MAPLTARPSSKWFRSTVRFERPRVERACSAAQFRVKAVRPDGWVSAAPSWRAELTPSHVGIENQVMGQSIGTAANRSSDTWPA